MLHDLWFLYKTSNQNQSWILHETRPYGMQRGDVMSSMWELMLSQTLLSFQRQTLKFGGREVPACVWRGWLLCPKQAKCSFYTCRFTQNASLLRGPVNRLLMWCFSSWPQRASQEFSKHSFSVSVWKQTDTKSAPNVGVSESHSRTSACLHGQYCIILNEGTGSGVYMHLRMHLKRIVFIIPAFRFFWGWKMHNYRVKERTQESLCKQDLNSLVVMGSEELFEH